MNNDEKVREMLKEEKVPKELEPESIRAMLDAKAPAKKRSKIKMAGRITAGAAACAVICGTAVHFAGQSNVLKDKKSAIDSEYEQITGTTAKTGDNAAASEDEPQIAVQASYMSGASDYSEVYKLFKTASDKYNEYTEEYEFTDEEVYYTDDEAVSTAATATNETAKDANVSDKENSEPEYSNTYNQEKDVLEPDIIKTDGKRIYRISNQTEEVRCESSSVLTTEPNQMLYVTDVADGKFGECQKIQIEADTEKIFGSGYSNVTMYVADFYLYNDMAAVICEANAWKDYSEYNNSVSCIDIDYCGTKDVTFVAFFSTGENVELIDTYYQEGSYSDARITPDGYMYLLTHYNTQNINNVTEENIKGYIPSRGMSGSFDTIEAENILMPECEITANNYFAYTVTGSIDMNESENPEPTAVKALAGYSGTIYSTANNLYTAFGYNETEITRIAIDKGNITPAANGKIKGHVNDQFSMSEYDGYFRIAATRNNSEYDDGVSNYIGRTNTLFVLDMNLNEVGRSSDFGNGEEIKSVNYDGNIAYVVTYEQTDPLFAIDLSDPASPAILDEFKILGYSKYMQKWSDGLLFGFGASADEYGIEHGVKLNMFDNSDPNELNAVDECEINGDESSYVYSCGLWERKALLIAPEKNIIGIPIETTYEPEWKIVDNNSEPVYYTDTGYYFYSFDNGKFNKIGEYSERFTTFDVSQLNRALYIGNNVYLSSDSELISLDMADFTVSDKLVY